MFSSIQPNTYVALHLPHGLHKVTKLVPDTTVPLGKYGSFNANLLFGRPYHLTFEILDKADDQSFSELRVVPASEIHAEALSETDPTPAESRDETVVDGGDGVQYDIVGENGELLMRNNRLTVDDSSRQALTMEEIEELKNATTSGSGKEIIAKIMQSHSALNEKTAFALAKYTLRKTKKYLRRFTVLPMDVSQLTQWMLHEKDAARILELREEVLGLMIAWSNVHCGGLPSLPIAQGLDSAPHHRYLVVEDTSGLVVAALAEKMGILHPDEAKMEHNKEKVNFDGKDEKQDELPTTEAAVPEALQLDNDKNQSSPANMNTISRAHHPRRHPPDAMSSTSNTITLVHPATQPNLSCLNYFSYDSTESGPPPGPIPYSDHPLHTHLKTISWLQLISPHLDTAYMEPAVVSDSELETWKSGKRGAYYRKRRRWERTARVVDETRTGGFDALVVASATSPDTILHNTVPLLRGGAPVVVYSPNIEALTELMDVYSSGRKSAFMTALSENPDADRLLVPSPDFPVDPRLLLGVSLQTVRAREWQVLPGRTHPLMTSRGGPEGYVFTATRVLPAEGRVEARGTFSKKRKIDVLGTLDAHGLVAESSEGMAT